MTVDPDRSRGPKSPNLDDDTAGVRARGCGLLDAAKANALA